MTKPESRAINEFEELAMTIIEKVRLGDGLDRDEFEKFIDQASKIVNLYLNKDYAPKRFFYGIWLVHENLLSSAENYQKNLSDEIKIAAGRLENFFEQTFAPQGV
jgi:hypothetical protein